VSLNRCEESLLRYVCDQADEKRHWTERVLRCERAGASRESCIADLERELRAYAAERGRADAALGEAFGAGRVSLRNLAEYLLTMWTPPRPRPPSSAASR